MTAVPVSRTRLILVSFLAISVVFGCCRFAYSVVLAPMRVGLDADRATMALLATANLVGYVVGSGAAAARRGAGRAALVPSFWICAVLFVALAAVPSTTLAAPLLLGLGIASGLGFVGVTEVLSTAPLTGRGRALGWAMSGIGGGIVLSSGWAAALFAVNPTGWRVAWLGLGGYAALVAWAVHRTFGARLPAEAADPGTPAGAVARRRWVIFPVYLSWGLGYVIHATFLPEFLHEERGVSTGTASLLFGLSGASMLLASPVIGRVADRFGRTAMFAFCLACAVVAVGLVVTLRSMPAYAGASLLFGVAVSGIGSLTPAFIADAWPAHRFAPVFGGLTAVFGIAQAAGPSVASVSIAVSGSLSTVYSGSLVILAVALAAVFALPRQRPTVHAASEPGSRHAHLHP
jgi:MFS family permease